MGPRRSPSPTPEVAGTTRQQRSRGSITTRPPAQIEPRTRAIQQEPPGSTRAVPASLGPCHTIASPRASIRVVQFCHRCEIRWQHDRTRSFHLPLLAGGHRICPVSRLVRSTLDLETSPRRKGCRTIRSFATVVPAIIIFLTSWVATTTPTTNGPGPQSTVPERG